MAQKVAVAYTDDIDGTRAAETVSFALDGARYEIDLSARNAKALRKVLATYQAAGRQVGPSASRGRPATPRRARASAAASKPAPSKAARSRTAKAAAPKAQPPAVAAAGAAGPSNADIRAWATANGLEISARGRISDQVRQQYTDAHA